MTPAELLAAERSAFETKIWGYYQGLKARGWAHPDEGDSNWRESMFWKTDKGQYGVSQIEAAWTGWLMAKGLA